jgi:hypothetical protein
VRDEIAAIASRVGHESGEAYREEIDRSLIEFERAPSMSTLTALAELVDRVTPLYADINIHYDIDSSNDVVERDYGFPGEDD